MTVTSNNNDALANSTCAHDESTDWNTLYCSHLWRNSKARQAIINAPSKDNKLVKYCYTCRGKIRNYGITPPRTNFSPNDHSTPKLESLQLSTDTRPNVSFKNRLVDSSKINTIKSSSRNSSITDIAVNNIELTQYIPTISSQLDVSFRRKFTSAQYEVCPRDISQRRLRKSLKGIGCIVNFSLAENSKKKRTQIQACSICVMIIAIVVISLILVNYTTFRFIDATNTNSTILVPTENIDINETSSAIVSMYTDLSTAVQTTEKPDTEDTTTDNIALFTTKDATNVSNIILKIRKNIKTYPKDGKKNQEIKKDIINRDLSQKFCSCQRNEVCMLDEVSGMSICKVAIDMEDPTGCGGLCALETEACQLVDKARGVRVCRLLTQVTCSSQDWRCRNGFCVPSTARCDGHIHCYDRSDEMHCDCDLTKQFRCGHSISCFSNKKMCDGLIDCWDGFDELNCTIECPQDQFTCTDGQCILSSRFCDGYADCPDESDEPQGCDGACGTHEIQCKNRRCVPKTIRCDGRDDCGDNSDEINCS